MKRCIRCKKILMLWNSKKGGFMAKRKDGKNITGKYCNKCTKKFLRDLFAEGNIRTIVEER